MTDRVEKPCRWKVAVLCVVLGSLVGLGARSPHARWRRTSPMPVAHDWDRSPLGHGGPTYDFAGAVMGDEQLERRLSELAEPFYTGPLSESIAKQSGPDLLLLVPGGRSDHEIRMIQKTLLVRHGFGGSRFGCCLRAYLIWELLEEPALGSDAVDMYLSAEPGELPEERPDFVRVAPGVLWDAIKAYTYQYEAWSREELRDWWSEHRHENRACWARNRVDRIVAKEGVPPVDQREVALKVTRNLDAAQPDKWDDFKQWWARVRKDGPTSWQKDLIERSFAGLRDGEAGFHRWGRGADQLFVVTGMDLWHRVAPFALVAPVNKDGGISSDFWERHVEQRWDVLRDKYQAHWWETLPKPRRPGAPGVPPLGDDYIEQLLHRWWELNRKAYHAIPLPPIARPTWRVWSGQIENAQPKGHPPSNDGPNVGGSGRQSP